MSGGILRFPWTTQPQSPVDIDPKWLARGLTFLNLGNGRYWQKGKGWMGTGTIVGGPKNTTGKLGVSKGFGATLGTGTTDRINAGVVPTSANGLTSVVAHFYLNGLGGGNLGRVFQDTAGTGINTGDIAMYMTTGARISYTRVTSGNGGQWGPTAATATGKWTSFGVSHDASSLANNPALWVDGSSASVTEVSTPSGAYLTNGTTLAWGNRPSDSARGWDGLLGPVAFFDCLLTEAEHKALNDNIWQLLAPVERKIWVPNAGGGGVSGTLATTNANDTSAATGTTTVTGTLATTNANDSSSASGTTTVTGTLATTNANDTSAASGSPVVVGTLATTNANDSVVASGDVGGNITGTVNYTNANDTSAASGTTTVTGSLATTNANDSASASGTTTVTGTSAYTNANDSVVASGAAGTVTGTVNVTNANDTADAYGIGAPNNDSGDGSMSRKRYYLRRKGKILLFDTVAQADDYLEAEEEAQKAIAAAKSRGAKKRIAAKILKAVEPVESVEIAPLQELVKAYSVPVNLPQLLSQQDYSQVMDVRAMIQRIQDDEDDELLLLLA